ncbi:MAG: AAA family ATPase [Clostridium sp.]
MIKIKKISLGTSDFKEIIDNNYYFIDKTLIVKEFLDDAGKVVLLPRPRRFGKTLNLSIIRYFLERSTEDRSYLFQGLRIEREKDIMDKQGIFPIIYLTFKDDKHTKYSSFINIMKYKISDLYGSFDVIYNGLKPKDKKYFDSIVNVEASEELLEISLFKLSEYLNNYYKQKVIILIDEYDTPIHEGYFNNYYIEIIRFMRNLLSSALKDNVNLEKAMITGILRVAKESIFSGINNLSVYSILSHRYSDKFGFTEDEVYKLLKDNDSDSENEEIKTWYNGYIFGETTIYNPWSILSYINEQERGFMPYWVNTAENKIIRTLLAQADEETKKGLEILYRGGCIDTQIDEDIVMSDISMANQNIWSFLLLSGYLKVIGKRHENNKFYYRIAIPNIEITILYENIIEKWFIEGFVDSEYKKMLKALIDGDIKNFSKCFKRYVITSFSYFDTSGRNPEKVYHAFTLGMLISLSSTHEVISNRESGIGRYDVSVIPKDITKSGIIFEFKRYDKEDEETIEYMADTALEQIEKNQYDTELKNKGIKSIIKIAIVFNGKEVYIKQKIE